MSSDRSLLAVSNLGIRRGKTTILHEITWRVERGQHWIILGANGSGKTSLLSALTGYLMPTEGTIELLGERYGESDWRELRKRVGIVSSSIRQQMAEAEPALISVASGKYAMIDFWGKPSRGDLRKARTILKQIECNHIADRPWSVLSQGERQRVLIGRALMARPAVLILDEPCAGLDPVAREHFLQFLDRLVRGDDAPTLILVTHHVEEIRPGFTHVLALKDGAVLGVGRKRELLTSKILSNVFENPVTLRNRAGVYSLSVAKRPWFG